MHCKLGTSHQRSLPSLPPLTTRSPLGAQVSAETTPGCPPKARTRVPLCASHTSSSPLSLLPEPEARRLPSGLHPTPDTSQRWPRNILGSVPPPLPATFQRLTTVSAPALAISVPSGLQSRSKRQAV